MDRAEEAFWELHEEQMFRLMNDSVQAEHHRLATKYYERETDNGNQNHEKLQSV